MSTVLLTGATGLIGSAITAALLERGDTVVYTTTSAAKVAQMSEKFAANDERLVGIVCDLTAENATAGLVAAIAARGLKVNYFVSNARSLKNVMIKDWREVTRAQWQGEFALDVIASYELTMALVAAGMPLAGVVNVASMYGLVGYNDYLCEGSSAIAINYGVAKAALIQLTRELAVRLAPTVRVNAISYGGVAGRADDAFQARYARVCPSREMLAPEETAGHVLYLCSDASRGMTGANLVVDGGFTAW